MNKTKPLNILCIIVLCLAVTVALTFAINTAFKHDEPLVYITRTGTKYHSGDCGYLWASALPMGEYEAKNSGYSPCSRCGGESCETVVVNNYGLSFCISLLTVALGSLAVIGIVFKVKRKLPRLYYIP